MSLTGKKEVSVWSGRKLWLLAVLRARWRHRFDAEYYSLLFFRESLKRGKVSTIFICSSPRRASLIAVLCSVLLELASFNKVQTLAVPILRYHFSPLVLFDLHAKRCSPRVWTRLGLFRSSFLTPSPRYGEAPLPKRGFLGQELSMLLHIEGKQH